MGKMGTGAIHTLAVVVVAAVVMGMLSSKSDRASQPQNAWGDGHPDKALFSKPVPETCTIFTASYGNRVLFGNNEDWINPKTYYWVVPPRGADYGVVYLGFDNLWPQGGINEKGLAFDVNALPKAPLNPHPERPKVTHPFYAFLKTCSTVEEVMDRVKSHSWERAWRAQLHVADGTGDAVVISAGPDGEIAFTRKQKGNGYLVSTNFNRANPENGRYPCWRYNTAVAMLEKIQAEESLTADYFRSILQAVHQQGPSVNTVYSNVFDLKNGIIYLYHWHRFGEVAKLHAAEEVKRAPSPTPLRALFSKETVEQASKEYTAYKKKVDTWKNGAWVWFLLAAASLVALIRDLARGTPAPWGMRLVWVLVVALFGPVGFLAYLVSYLQPVRLPALQAAPANWRCALGETVFGAAGYAMGLALAFASFYLVLSFGDSSLWSLAARLYGLPLIIGWFLFHAPLLAFIAENQYWTAVRRRFPAEIVSLNFMLVGMLPVSGILLGLCEQHLGLRGPGSVLFWGVITLGAFAGALILYPVNVYMARRGFSCWPVRLFKGGEDWRKENAMVMPSLSNAWGVVLLSFVLLSVTLAIMF